MSDDPEAWRETLHRDLTEGRARKQAAAAPPRRWHDSAAWERRAKQFLINHPKCVGCECRGRHARATRADHIVPISQGGDVDGPLQPLCSYCHQSIKRRLENLYRKGECTAADLHITSALALRINPPMCQLDGRPSALNIYHPWRKQ
jgi:hypothetical protein